MTQTTARIKQGGKLFEIKVDLDEALKFKKGEINSIEAEGDKIFTDIKKGNVASNSDLESAFQTTDTQEIIGKLIRNGEILVSQEHRSAEQEQKIKQVVDFLSRNALDPKSGNPHTAERIKGALDQAHVNIQNAPIESQMKDIITALSQVLPIKLETKRIKITIPAIHTGQIYGVVNQYKEKENWLDDGSLEVIAAVPSGILMDFYDKLNAVTHGSALTEDLKGEETQE